MSFEAELQSFMAAIRQRESSGNYQAFNKLTHSKYGNARGAYQIMSGIWDGWAKQAGLAGANWRDPAAQDAVARHKMSYYYRKYGDWRLVAAAWHGGEGAANAIAKGKGWGSDMNGTATTDYARQVVGLMGNTPNHTRNNPTGQDEMNIIGSVRDENVAAGVVDADAPLGVTATTQRDELRKTYGQVLTTMSQVIAGNPSKYAGIYGVGPDPDMVTGTVPQEVE